MSTANRSRDPKIDKRELTLALNSSTGVPAGSQFADIVDLYLAAEGRGSATQLAGAFGTAPSTVTRWARGKTCPHAIVREQVVNYIRDRIVGESSRAE